MSFLSPGRGLRNARLSDIDRRGVADAPAVGLGGCRERRRPGAGRFRIGTGRDGAERRAPRDPHRRRAGARARRRLAERLGVMWLTPQMDRLFIEGPAGRRRLLDRLVLGLDPAHAAAGRAL